MKAGFLILMTVFLLGCSNGHAAKVVDIEDYAKIQEQLLNKVYSTRMALVVLQNTGDILWSGEDRFKRMSSVNVSEPIQQIVVGAGFSLCLLEDGQVLYYGNREKGDFFEGKLENVKMLGATEGATFALFEDGTVRCLFNRSSYYKEVYEGIDEWKEIESISGSICFLVGLRKDGTALVLGDIGTDNWCKVTEWTDIIQVAAGYTGVIGLKNDGTVIASGIYADDGKSGTPPPDPD